MRQIFVHIQDRLASYTFAFHPLGHKVLKAKKRNVEVSNEEECKEIWQRRKISKNSYINPDIDKLDIVFGKLKRRI